MPKPAVSDKQFIEVFREFGAAETARRLKVTERAVYKRRASLERAKRISVASPNEEHRRERLEYADYPQRTILEISDGIILVAGDAHYWPGPAPIMHRALVKFCKELKPRVVVFNGDIIDAPTISRFMPIGWEHRPKLADEINNAKDRLSEIEKAAFKADKVWNLGNHDKRYESRLAHVAPEYAQINGLHLHDHFPLWRTAWATWINDDIVIKHRFKGGIHAPHNNTLWAGKTMITGHLHSAKIVPLSDYNGTRYGVDTGCIADINHAAFVDYTEDGPKNWRSAFCVLTFRGGKLLQPELVLKWDEKSVQFRGKVLQV